MHHLPQIILPLLLPLLLCCSGACPTATAAANNKKNDGPTAHRCRFNEMMEYGDAEVVTMVQELPRRGQGAWRAYTAAAEPKSEESEENWEPIRIVVSSKDLDNSSRYCTKEGEKRPSFMGYDNECREGDILTSRNKATLLQTVVPSAIKLHADRLRVKRLTSPLNVPESISTTQCKHFTVPPEHHTTGVTDADLVLYVAAGPSWVFAIPCVAIAEKDRPTVGAMNFPLSGVFFPWFAARVAAHEIAHVLGFGYDKMNALGMLTSPEHGVRSNAPKTVRVISPLTKAKAQEHFACSTMDGMPLRDDYDDHAVMISHWDKRYAKDELMGSTVENGAGFYTALTMAAFSDMPFYSANFSMAEPMSWGKGVGCEFINRQYKEDDHKKYPSMFCPKDANLTDASYCTSDRTSLGYCYASRGDNFHVIRPAPFKSCREDTLIVSGSRHGPGSWCLDGDSLVVNGETLGPQPKVSSVNGVCAEVFCARNGVKVRYLGDDDWYDCPEGKYISPAETSADFVSGRIKCPMYAEVCSITPSGRSAIDPLADPPSNIHLNSDYSCSDLPELDYLQ